MTQKKSVLDSATNHFRAKISGKMRSIRVPEWDAEIWFKETNTLTEESRLINLAQAGKTVEALVETLIIKARFEDGTKMFTVADKAAFMNEVDPNVIIRIVGEMNIANAETLDGDLVAKN